MEVSHFLISKLITKLQLSNQRSTGGSQVTSFHSILMRKNNLQSGPRSVWSLYVLPMHAWVFSRYSSFLPPKMCMLGELPYLNCPSLSVGRCVSVALLKWCAVQGGFPPCQYRLWTLATLNWNKQVGK